MSAPTEFDLIYDRLVAEEKLKKGSKYERLAAIAFAALERQTTIHDLRLRGSSGVRHQIDVTVGPERSRLLIECKEYESKIGLGIVRDFFGVVEDVRPDRAFVVTTVGYTRPAKRYAKAKGIQLTLLRKVEPQDLQGRVQRIHITLKMTGLDVTGMEWEADPADPGAQAAADRPGQSVMAAEAGLVDPAGIFTPLNEFIQRGLDVRDAYDGEPGPRSGVHRFEEPHILVTPDGQRLGVRAVRWDGQLSAGEQGFAVGLGIGGLVAELALLTVSGDVMSILSNKEIAKFSFDDRGHVRSSSDRPIGRAGPRGPARLPQIGFFWHQMPEKRANRCRKCPFSCRRWRL